MSNYKTSLYGIVAHDLCGLHKKVTMFVIFVATAKILAQNGAYFLGGFSPFSERSFTKDRRGPLHLDLKTYSWPIPSVHCEEKKQEQLACWSI